MKAELSTQLHGQDLSVARTYPFRNLASEYHEQVDPWRIASTGTGVSVSHWFCWGVSKRRRLCQIDPHPPQIDRKRDRTSSASRQKLRKANDRPLSLVRRRTIAREYHLLLVLPDTWGNPPGWRGILWKTPNT
jgi:hypothetical protein